MIITHRAEDARHAAAWTFEYSGDRARLTRRGCGASGRRFLASPAQKRVAGRDVPVEPAPMHAVERHEAHIRAAYRQKYADHGATYVDAMISPDAAATTLQVSPE